MNPNACESCKHRKHPDGGWCYMFAHEPSQPCFHHTEAGALGVVLKPLDQRTSERQT